MSNVVYFLENQLRVALIGASSRIGRDLVQYSRQQKLDLSFDLYNSRETDFFGDRELGTSPASYRSFTPDQEYDLVVNCVGRGSPKLLELEAREFAAASVFFDDLCLDYIGVHNSTKYIYLSSGAVYSNFDEEKGATNNHPVMSVFDNPYANTKRLIEARHRELPHLAIYDIRIFGYISKSLNLNDGSFFSDTVAALVGDDILTTDNQDFFRDYCTVSDFANLVSCIIDSPWKNEAFDLYSQKPVAKFELLRSLEHNFGLRYSISPASSQMNTSPTGQKRNYFSSSRTAETLGYAPNMTSLESCIEIVRHTLKIRQAL